MKNLWNAEFKIKNRIYRIKINTKFNMESSRDFKFESNLFSTIKSKSIETNIFIENGFYKANANLMWNLK
ncbi:MAG: hypothetical protein K2P17_05210 [Helicobacteraceae bacterium]|nr:hypothetical protein [Helicobacteraceae bacterium]